MCEQRSSPPGFIAGLAFLATLLLFALSLEAVEPPALNHCPMTSTSDAAGADRSRPVRRLRETAAAGPESSNVDSDLAELAFVTSTRPNPRVESMLQVPGAGNLTTLQLTVVNNSRHASPDGGITLSFPALSRPSDRARIGKVVIPEGMALHVIPAGGRLFGRNGLEQRAKHLMIEVHGPWRPRQTRTLEIEISGTSSAIPVRYRSAMSDSRGTYHNTPRQSASPDQQGWPAHACMLGGNQHALAGNSAADTHSAESGSGDRAGHSVMSERSRAPDPKKQDGANPGRGRSGDGE